MTRRMGLFSTWRGRTLWKASEFVSLDYLARLRRHTFFCVVQDAIVVIGHFALRRGFASLTESDLGKSRAVNN